MRLELNKRVENQKIIIELVQYYERRGKHTHSIEITLDDIKELMRENIVIETPKLDKKSRIDANGNSIPWSSDHDYFMGFDPENPDIPTD